MVTMAALRRWAEAVFAATVMETWTPTKQDTATPSRGSVCVASAIQPGDTVRSVSLVTMEMQ